ncbi:NAD(P)/FAD-dependent oxidoreductase [Kineosporia sp. R_H_3]|uniref:dihydrolipoyl dehydrogenase family protein n=1 Tax=Kineosporia sp. R_H_3 TaxID=1961848 RepID=UPI0018E94FC5|nr:FAD-dependent oxidoreductase [Kineosporia sp. R_H_3]
MTASDPAALPAPPPGGWDLLVVGGGTAGIVAAKTAAGFGASVLLVERERMGGDCLWTGCVPSKALLSAAATAASARRSGTHGVHTGVVEVDFPAVMKHVRAAVATIEPADSVETMEAAGVRVVAGDLTFTGRRTAWVGGVDVPFRQAVLAMGASPAVPPVPGLAEAVATGHALTSDTVWDLADLPERLVVLGGGSIGCELGQAFARLGATVTVVEAAPGLLPREDLDAAAVVTDALREDGVTVLTGAAVRQVLPDGPASGRLVLDGDVEVAYDRLLVAVGRTPRTAGLGLETAGVRVDRRGFVQLDKALRTNNPRIWAAGDITGHPQFTHTAGVHASTAASNAVLGLHRAAQTTAIPRVTFTDPEVAAVGVPATDADGRPGWRVVTRRHDEVDRAVAEADTAGFARLVLDGKGRVRGATVVGPRAGESLAELVLAVRLGLRSRDLAGTVHAYPTYGDGPWNAAIADVRAQLATPRAARAVGVLVGLRRRWLGLRG